MSDINCQLKALDDRFDTFAWGFKVWFVDNKKLQYSSTPMNNPVRTKSCKQRPVSPEGISRS